MDGEFKSNSHKLREKPDVPAQKPRAEKVVSGKVVSGKVKTQKKGELSKFASMFLPEDVNDVKSYIICDILIPLGKKALDDIFHTILYPGGQKRPSSPASRISYNSYYDRDDRTRERSNYRDRVEYTYDNITLYDRGEVEEVLDRLNEIVDEYGFARVADLYDLVGITGTFTDNDYGWKNLQSASYLRTSDGGYLLKLPRARVIS